MKFSIITPVKNNRATIQDTIESILSQRHGDIEHIIVDGVSTDGTIDVVNRYGNRIASFISEPDGGIYDAINKGISKATGDIVGILNADDFYVHDHVISQVEEAFLSHKKQAVFADVRFVLPNNLEKTVRYYSSANFSPSKFKWGFMPAHPTFLPIAPII